MDISIIDKVLSRHMGKNVLKYHFNFRNYSFIYKIFS